ncbi:uncharacterized protein LOC143773547 isoform X1 [Ranitomeya variabilis]|uniref:uncharacterized protein LOC143773547 isoform X1 n=1 Tax=Ranitomeya variabilis TaxID=490064 RepID=UPI00405785A6
MPLFSNFLSLHVLISCISFFLHASECLLVLLLVRSFVLGRRKWSMSVRALLLLRQRQGRSSGVKVRWKDGSGFHNGRMILLRMTSSSPWSRSESRCGTPGIHCTQTTSRSGAYGMRWPKRCGMARTTPRHGSEMHLWPKSKHVGVR